jgi:hypothetical protein
MVHVTRPALDSMHDGLAAAAVAIRSFRNGCQSLRAMPESARIAEQLDLAIERLGAMHADLERRIASPANQDGLFVGLYVAEAGMSSLTDSLGEMRHAAAEMQSRAQLRMGWFIEPAP